MGEGADWEGPRAVGSCLRVQEGACRCGASQPCPGLSGVCAGSQTRGDWGKGAGWEGGRDERGFRRGKSSERRGAFAGLPLFGKNSAPDDELGSQTGLAFAAPAPETSAVAVLRRCPAQAGGGAVSPACPLFSGGRRRSSGTHGRLAAGWRRPGVRGWVSPRKPRRRWLQS